MKNSEFNNTNHYVSEFNQIAQDLVGKDIAWLKELRASALQQLMITGFPTTRDEDWKYTNTNVFTKKQFSYIPNLVTSEIKDINLANDDYHQLVFINGLFTPQLSNINNLPTGVVVSNIAQMLAKNPTVLEPYLKDYINKKSNGFTALNTSFLNDGAYIYLPENCILAKPIKLLFIANTDQQAFLAPPRNIISLAKNSQAVILEHYMSKGTNQHFTNAITDVVLHEKTNLTHYKLLEENEQTFHIGNVNVQQAKHSQFNSYVFTLGGNLVRSDTNVAFNDEHANCNLYGLYLAYNQQHIDHHICIEHNKPHCKSQQVYKGIINNHGRAVFNGKVIVQPQAIKTDAQQSNKNLLLSANAEIDTKPQLEIYADDVRCAHGATVGQLDENAIFYLQTRGLSEKLARAALTYAFAREIIEHVPLLPLRTELQKKLYKYFQSNSFDL